MLPFRESCRDVLAVELEKGGLPYGNREVRLGACASGNRICVGQTITSVVASSFFIGQGRYSMGTASSVGEPRNRFLIQRELISHWPSRSSNSSQTSATRVGVVLGRGGSPSSANMSSAATT